MKRSRTALMLCTLATAGAFTGGDASAATPNIMMAECRARAGTALKVRLPDVDTRYEGQRTDGTHAVNGTATVRGRAQTFQCSFDRRGNRIIRFVVNRPSAPAAPTVQSRPASDAGTGTRTEAVRFRPGRSGASIRGTIAGDEAVSYTVGAESGQAMTIVLKPSNLATYFNVYAPGKRPGDQALGNSGVTGPTVPALNTFKAKLPASGTYTISVYMMRSAARRKERSDYVLDISISALNAGAARQPVQNDYADGLQGGPDYWEVTGSRSATTAAIHAAASAASAVAGNVPGGTVLRNQGCRMAEGHRWCRVETVAGPKLSGWTAGDALRESGHAGAPAQRKVTPAGASANFERPVGGVRPKGSGFTATGQIPCARVAGQPTTQCDFGVVRNGNGNGTLTVFWPEGGKRVIVFEKGMPVSFDQSAADGKSVLAVERSADLLLVRIGDQRLEIPDAVINGG